MKYVEFLSDIGTPIPRPPEGVSPCDYIKAQNQVKINKVIAFFSDAKARLIGPVKGPAELARYINADLGNTLPLVLYFEDSDLERQGITKALLREALRWYIETIDYLLSEVTS